MNEFDDHRARLLGEIEAEARETANWTGRPAFSQDVMAAMNDVPRHLFVAAGDEAQAYLNRPRGIGHGQTISQPYIVAAMTDLLDLDPAARVLEVGTGSGYQTAVLSVLAARVFSVEIIPQLAARAETRLGQLGYENIEFLTADGRRGWPDKSPFDAIMVTAASAEIPQDLISQLAAGGRMIIPLGEAGGTQTLFVGAKDGAGNFSAEAGLPVAFVPLVQG